MDATSEWYEMKIAQMGCKTARDGIIVAAVFFGMAVAMIVVAGSPLAFLDHVPAVLNTLAGVLLVMAALILLASLIRQGPSQR